MKCALSPALTRSPPLLPTLSPSLVHYSCVFVFVCVCGEGGGADIIKPTTARISLYVCVRVLVCVCVSVVVVGYENHFSKCTFYVWAEAEAENKRETSSLIVKRGTVGRG